MNRQQRRAKQQRGPGALTGNGGAATPENRCTRSVDQDEGAGNARARLRVLLDELEAAQELRMSRTSFRRIRAAGLISPVRLPLGLRRNLYSRDDVLRLAERIAAGEHASAG